jgi:hypothetical protein
MQLCSSHTHCYAKNREIDTTNRFALYIDEFGLWLLVYNFRVRVRVRVRVRLGFIIKVSFDLRMLLPGLKFDIFNPRDVDLNILNFNPNPNILHQP